ncbi:MAG: SIS domain-containing protein [Chloroflexota bacterium]|nr:SIS domain-containing protein [Dehalococcoidia bacterium]MDW8252879.1 SIS domain-containing protein [Chloroflexota bacterium]
MSAVIRQYLATAEAARQALDLGALAAAAARIAEARACGATVFLCGNGGSAATASHFATDLQKSTRVGGQPPVRAIALNDNVSVLTAWANDVDYCRVFAEPLATFARPGDVLVAISASGNSPNVLEAVATAEALGLTIIGLTGFDGGALRSRSTISIHIPVHSYEIAEDIHLMVCHLITTLLKAGAASADAAADHVTDGALSPVRS